jgi:hypothetical protein
MKWNHHKPLICNLKPIDGYYIPEFDIIKRPRIDDYYELKMIKNKGYRNLAYWLNSFILNAEQTLLKTDGASIAVLRKYTTASGTYYRSMNPYSYGFNFGASTSPHDVSRYELYSRWFADPIGAIAWLEELDTETRLQTYEEYSFVAPNKAIGEAGLYADFNIGGWRGYFLLARAIIEPVGEKVAMTVYKDGWRVTFPSNYTRHFLRAWYFHFEQGPDAWGRIIKDITGADFIVREISSFAGSPDVMIGRDNTAPSVTDYHLKDPIGSLSSQSHSVEIDTTLQECRIVRTGTYTPSVNETLGEVALYTNVYDQAGTSHKIMIARGVWDTPLTLVAGTPYTIGIVLRLG